MSINRFQSATMENLPPELFVIVLDNLKEVRDVLKLRLLSKRFKRVVDTYWSRSVILSLSPRAYSQDKYFKYLALVKSEKSKLPDCSFNALPVDRSAQIGINGLSTLTSTLQSSFFRGVQYLNISVRVSRFKFNIGVLNQLANLWRLDIEWLDAPKESTRLHLPNLVVLLVEQTCEDHYAQALVEFDSPKLEVLRQPDLDNAVQVLHPQSVRCLWINKLNDVNPRLDLLAKFKNLEIFQANYLHVTNIDVWSALSSNLQQLRFLAIFQYRRCQHVVEDYEGRVLDPLMAQKTKLGRQTKVFFTGVQLIDGKPYDEHATKTSDHSFLANYRNLLYSQN